MNVGAFHLTYCTNIHPGETWAEVEENLRAYTLPLKQQLSPSDPFGVGLRLSNQAAENLLEGTRLSSFKDWLEDEGLYVFTLNGFPYGDFHRRVVKDDVYRPDWRESERAQYTGRLIQVLDALLPDGLDGSISTSPLSYKPWLSDLERTDALTASALIMAPLAFSLFELRERAGRLIHLGIEPEPDCLVENGPETVAWFEDSLLMHGAALLRTQFGLSRTQAEELLREHIRICYDTCHFAVEYEAAGDAFDLFRRSGIEISKVQISAALRVDLAQNRSELEKELDAFAESTYLHQVVSRTADGTLMRYPDLPQALPELRSTEDEEWRIHYHVPIFIDRYERLHSTQTDISSALDYVTQHRPTLHLEIETYTWEVLPSDLRLDVVASIHREYEWTLEQLSSGRKAGNPRACEKLSS